VAADVSSSHDTDSNSGGAAAGVVRMNTVQETENLKVEIRRLTEEIEMLKLNQEYFRYAHEEIEYACGGETAMAVRNAVLLRRYKIASEGR
jgi:hypothetical protein